MKLGDMVRHRHSGLVGTRVGLVIDVIEKKCWRTSSRGVRIDWDSIDPEPHAVVMYSEDSQIAIPAIELEVVNEGR